MSCRDRGRARAGAYQHAHRAHHVCGAVPWFSRDERGPRRVHALTSGFGVAAGDLSLFGLRAVALVLVLVGTVAVRLVRNTLPERRAGGTFETWWAAGGARAPIVWGAAEGVGVLGAMLYVFTGDTLTLALPFVWSVAVFVMHPPSRLLGG